MGKVIDATFTGGRRDSPVERALRVCTGAATGEILPTGDEEIIIGRASTADLRLDDDLVSQHHAKLVPQADGSHILRDLDSSNGTFVNNELIHATALENGDFIQIGDTVLQYISSQDGEPLHAETIRRAAVPPSLAQAAQRMMVRARHIDGDAIALHAPAVPAVQLPHVGAHAAHLSHQVSHPGLGSIPPGVVPPVAVAEPEATLKDYFDLAIRVAKFFIPHWKAIIAVALLGALAGIGAFYAKPPPKKAFFEMSLAPDAREVRMNAFEEGAVSFFGATEQNFKSLNLIEKTLLDIGNQDPNDGLLTAMQRFLEFQEVGDPYERTRTFVASFSAQNGEFALAFLKAHLENYLETEIDKKLKVINVEADFLKSQVTEAKKALSHAEERLLAFKQENVAALPDQARQYYELLFDLQRRQSEASKEIASLKSAMELDRSKLTRESPLMRSSVTTNRPYEQSIAEINAKLAAAKASGQGDRHPEVIQLKKQLSELEELAKEFEQQGRGHEVQSVNPEYQDIRTTLRRLEAQREMAKNEAARVSADLRKVEGIVASLPKIEAEYKEITRDFQSAQDLYTDLSNKLQATQLQVELERASAAARYDIITPPRLEFFSPKQLLRKRAMMGTAAGVFLGFIIVWIREYRRGNVLSLKLV